jgi:hypothetical protein
MQNQVKVECKKLKEIVHFEYVLTGFKLLYENREIEDFQITEPDYK